MIFRVYSITITIINKFVCAASLVLKFNYFIFSIFFTIFKNWIWWIWLKHLLLILMDINKITLGIFLMSFFTYFYYEIEVLMVYISNIRCFKLILLLFIKKFFYWKWITWNNLQYKNFFKYYCALFVKYDGFSTTNRIERIRLISSL